MSDVSRMRLASWMFVAVAIYGIATGRSETYVLASLLASVMCNCTASVLRALDKKARPHD